MRSDEDKKTYEEASAWLKKQKNPPVEIRNLLLRFEELLNLFAWPLSPDADLFNEDWVWNETQQKYMQVFYVTEDTNRSYWEDIDGNVIEGDKLFWVQPEWVNPKKKEDGTSSQKASEAPESNVTAPVDKDNSIENLSNILRREP